MPDDDTRQDDGVTRFELRFVAGGRVDQVPIIATTATTTKAPAAPEGK